MQRLQLFEIHDLSWCPRVFRDGLTDFLATSIRTFDTYGPIRDRLLSAIRETGATRVIDLCSGAGGAWATWASSVQNLPPVLLTDKFPNRDAAGKQIRQGLAYCDESVDATKVPAHLTGFRTIFTAAHHFEPETVRKMIADAVEQRQPIGIFELTHRSPRAILYMALSPIGVWLLTPRMRRITLSKLLFTYVIPVIPLMTAFDGIVSCLRTYTPEELREMATAPTYKWSIGTSAGGPVPITYLIGIPD